MTIPTSESIYKEMNQRTSGLPQEVKDLVTLGMLTSRIDEIFIQTERLTGLLEIINKIQNRDSNEELNATIECLIKTISVGVANIVEQHESLDEEAALLTEKLSKSS